MIGELILNVEVHMVEVVFILSLAFAVVVWAVFGFSSDAVIPENAKLPPPIPPTLKDSKYEYADPYNEIYMGISKASAQVAFDNLIKDITLIFGKPVREPEFVFDENCEYQKPHLYEFVLEHGYKPMTGYYIWTAGLSNFKIDAFCRIFQNFMLEHELNGHNLWKKLGRFPLSNIECLSYYDHRIDLHEWIEKCKNEAASITQSPSEDYLNFHKNLVPWKPS